MLFSENTKKKLRRLLLLLSIERGALSALKSSLFHPPRRITPPIMLANFVKSSARGARETRMSPGWGPEKKRLFIVRVPNRRKEMSTTTAAA